MREAGRSERMDLGHGGGYQWSWGRRAGGGAGRAGTDSSRGAGRRWSLLGAMADGLKGLAALRTTEHGVNQEGGRARSFL